MKIIGITGTLGAGKGTIVEFLVEKHGYKHYSVRNYLIEEIKKRGLPVNRDSMVLVGNDLREKNSPSFIVEQLYKQAKNSNSDCVIESIRTVGEAKMLKEKENAYLFAVDADINTRYKRILERASETDHIDFDTFIENEAREMKSDNPNQQNLSACMAMSDAKLINNGSFEDLNKNLDKILNKLNGN